MNIALIQPEIPQSEDEDLLGIYPPLGLAWLAGNTSGYHTQVVDLRCEPLIIGSWDVVGITCQTVSLNKCSIISQKIKSHLPDAIIITGGHHPLPCELLDFSDYTVRGEGEIVFTRLLSCIEDAKDITSIPNISSHRVHTPDGPPADITALHPPDYDCVPLKTYHPNQGAMVTSRGCPYTCIFCTRPFGRTWRGRTPAQVAAEAEALLARGANILHIMDDLFTYDRTRVFTICEMLTPFHTAWDLPNGTRVDTVDQPVLDAMAKSGCTRILYGIESGVDSVLKTIQKQITLDQIQKAVSMAKNAGIHVEGLFMVGNPGDTPKTITETVEFVKSLDITGHFSLATPYPGTDFWTWVEKNGTFLPVAYEDFEQVPVFETPDFSADDRLHMLQWAAAECK
jgi:radical SAM superfamily enzyme YgiQ (UPF0313 family)